MATSFAAHFKPLNIDNVDSDCKPIRSSRTVHKYQKKKTKNKKLPYKHPLQAQKPSTSHIPIMPLYIKPKFPPYPLNTLTQKKREKEKKKPLTSPFLTLTHPPLYPHFPSPHPSPSPSPPSPSHSPPSPLSPSPSPNHLSKNHPTPAFPSCNR